MATTQFSQSSIPYPLTTKDLKIGIAFTEWNKHITSILLKGAVDTLLDAGLNQEQIQVASIPGAFELPLAAQMLFNTQCDAVLCFGAVVRGETPHFDYVCKAATEGILKVGLDQNKPCIFGVLTVDNEAQAMERCGGVHGHKGKEAATTALWMLAVNQKLNERPLF